MICLQIKLYSNPVLACENNAFSEVLESVGNFKVYSPMLHYNSSSHLPFQNYYLYYLSKKPVSFDFFNQSNYSLTSMLKKALKLSIPVDSLMNVQYSSSPPVSSLLTESSGLHNKKIKIPC